jgi:hypothetical protein
MKGWNPIGSAPKDGSEIIVGIPYRPERQFRVRWDWQYYYPPKWSNSGMSWSEGVHGPTHWKHTGELIDEAMKATPAPARRE